MKVARLLVTLQAFWLRREQGVKNCEVGYCTSGGGQRGRHPGATLSDAATWSVPGVPVASLHFAVFPSIRGAPYQYNMGLRGCGLLVEWADHRAAVEVAWLAFHRSTTLRLTPRVVLEVTDFARQ
jgi:hypothetical protein